MAVENLGKCVTLTAAADLSSYQYRFIKVDSSGYAALCGDGQDADGVLQNDPGAAGRAANVMVGVGITKITAGGTCTAGGDAASDANGRAVNAASGDYIKGVFLESATGAGQIIKMIFQPSKATL